MPHRVALPAPKCTQLPEVRANSLPSGELVRPGSLSTLLDDIVIQMLIIIIIIIMNDTTAVHACVITRVASFPGRCRSNAAARQPDQRIQAQADVVESAGVSIKTCCCCVAPTCDSSCFIPYYVGTLLKVGLVIGGLIGTDLAMPGRDRTGHSKALSGTRVEQLRSACMIYNAAHTFSL